MKQNLHKQQSVSQSNLYLTRQGTKSSTYAVIFSSGEGNGSSCKTDKNKGQS